MKRIKFTEHRFTQIVKAIKEHENGRNAHDLPGVRNQYGRIGRQRGGMEVKELSKLKTLEEENARLKKMYANLNT